MGKYGPIAVVLIVLVIAGILWATTRRVVAVVPPPPAPVPKPPTTPEEDKAKLAAEEAEKALWEMRMSKYERIIAEQAAATQRLEQQLVNLQAAAILNPTDIDLAAEVAQKEQEATTARTKLLADWTADLSLKLGLMRTAEVAARSAMDAYSSAMSRVSYWISKANDANFGVQKMNTLLQTEPAGERRDIYLANHSNYIAWQEDYKQKAKDAKLAAVATHSFAVLAVSKADDAINNIFALTRDLQNLGILLDLARRTDAIAGATRTKLAEFEKRLADDPSKVVIPEYTIPALPPAPTVVAPPTLAPPTAITMTYEQAKAEADRTGGQATWTPELGWHVVAKAEVIFPAGF